MIHTEKNVEKSKAAKYHTCQKHLSGFGGRRFITQSSDGTRGKPETKEI
jgi:hypothetical protein